MPSGRPERVLAEARSNGIGWRERSSIGLAGFGAGVVVPGAEATETGLTELAFWVVWLSAGFPPTAVRAAKNSSTAEVAEGTNPHRRL